MTGYTLKINTTDITGYLKSPGGYTTQRAKLWKDAGRNMTGNLLSTFLGIFPKIKLNVRAGLSDSEISTLTTLLDNASFTVQWWDSKSQSYKTGTFYAGDFDIPLHTKGFYDTFQVSLISFNKLT